MPYPTDHAKERLRRNVLRNKARVSTHMLPQENKYRAAALGCMSTAHRYLRLFREEKARFDRIDREGQDSPWARAAMYRARREGGRREYLRMLLFFARSYLESAHRFGELAEMFRLP